MFITLLFEIFEQLTLLFSKLIGQLHGGMTIGKNKILKSLFFSKKKKFFYRADSMNRDNRLGLDNEI